ncbi:hypothetical protein O0Q50_23510 [Priestia aryabhattai]|uniref:DUF3784 domain-containing protein n=1 Tax=Priestia aryabhattai TaxID=412384 RepID=A0AAX6NEI9_PRIAR|nr:hypothetical protein [Priestia aryabhattai]MDU9694156.1 hypothetical protein [Priestia aryabhattai]
MERIFFVIVSFVCILFLVDHLAKIMAHNKFKEIEKMSGKTKFYITFLFLIGTFLYFFIIGNIYELFVFLGGPDQGAVPFYILFAVGVALLIFINKYSTFTENREKERLKQIDS